MSHIRNMYALSQKTSPSEQIVGWYSYFRISFIMIYFSLPRQVLDFQEIRPENSSYTQLLLGRMQRRCLACSADC